MPHKKRKTRKKRGSRTHGYGRVGQHRQGGGQKGGHGKTGHSKHKWSYTVKYEPGYFGKHGFKPPRRREVETINVGQLDEKVRQLLDQGKAVKEEDGVHVDLSQMGYDKLLGSGQVTHPLVIKVDSHSQSAEEKIESGKGQIISTEK